MPESYAILAGIYKVLVLPWGSNHNHSHHTNATERLWWAAWGCWKMWGLRQVVFNGQNCLSYLHECAWVWCVSSPILLLEIGPSYVWYPTVKAKQLELESSLSSSSSSSGSDLAGSEDCHDCAPPWGTICNPQLTEPNPPNAFSSQVMASYLASGTHRTNAYSQLNSSILPILI